MPRLVLVLGLAAAGAAGAAAKAPPAKAPPAKAAPAKPASEAPSLTLFELPDFAGRHSTFRGGVETVHQPFTAQSAKSTGLWTLCEGRDPASKCQTVNGSAPKLKIEPAIVRPGVDAVALYEKPGLQGRRVVYSFGSDIPPPFKPRSARTWGGAWSLCDDASGKCQVVDSERPVDIQVQVGLVKPGREPERLQLALAEPAPAPADPAQAKSNPIDDLADQAVKTPPAPKPAPPVRIAEAAAPAPPRRDEAAAPQELEPPRALAEAAPPPADALRTPYVDVPVPPRAAAPAADPDDEPEAREAYSPRPAPLPNPVRRASYSCADGQTLTVVFDDGSRTALVMTDGQRPQALQRTEGAVERGFFYEGSGHVLFGAGTRAGYASEGAQPVDCYLNQGMRRFSARGEDGAYYPGRAQRRQYDSYSPPSDEDSRRSW
jgi:hypothetical protein